MSEVEKMYVLVGIKNIYRCKSGQCIVTNPHSEWCNKCESLIIKYPDFTAEKQLSLIKWLGKYDYFEVYYRPVQKDWIFGSKTADSSHYDFTLGLASWIAYIWQDLTEQERTEIRSILKG